MKIYFSIAIFFILSGLLPLILGLPSNPPIKDGAASFEGYQVLRIKTRSKGALDFLEKLYVSDVELFDFWSSPNAEVPVDVAVNSIQADYLRTSLATFGVYPRVLIPDLQKLIETGEKDSVRQEAPLDWTSYHQINSIYSWIDSLPSQYPNIVKVLEIGKSYENRTLKLVRISTSTGGDNKPAVWLDGGIHAREWVSPATLTYIIAQLLNETETESRDANVSKLVDLFDWYIMPLVNPDGYDYSWTNNRMWRKTRSAFRSQSSAGKGPKSIWDTLFGNCAGVDANRNFNVKWGGKGTSSNPCSDIYRGPKAGSEAEVAAVQDFILEHREQIKLFLTAHSYSQMILIPWAYDHIEPEDFADLKSIAERSAQAIYKVHGTSYRAGQTTKLLGPAAGSSKDWAKQVADIKYSFAFELRDTGTHGFILPAEQIIPTAQEIYAGIRSMVQDVAVIYNVTRS